MTEEEKKEFEEFLKWKAERTSANASPTDTGKGAVKLDVNANVNAKITPTVNIGWYQKLTSGQKNCLMIYVVWTIVHILLLVSGEGRDHFFPRIYKTQDLPDYTHLRQHGWAPVPPEHWTIKWDLDYYGFPEFIVYVFLVPVIVFFIYVFLKNKNMTQTPTR